MRDDSPRIAVLSGKGGTGKTLVAVNLAAAAAQAVYVDCDVEEPNGHLFFKPPQSISEKFTVTVPVVDQDGCTGCRRCVDFCKFNALAHVGGQLIIFEELCHSCGGCILLCPALTVTERAIGRVQTGFSGRVTVRTGILNTGEASGVPIVKHLLRTTDPNGAVPVFLDGPPGSGCSVMECVRAADYCILVAEPSVFGVTNLDMAYKLVQLFKKPCGAVLNKTGEEENPAENYCREKGIPILGRIPFDRELGILNSNAKIAARENKKYRGLFSSLLENVIKEVRDETAADSQR